MRSHMAGASGGAHVRTKPDYDQDAQHELHSFFFLLHLCLIISHEVKSAAHAKTALHAHTEQNKGTARKISPFLPYQASFQSFNPELNERFH